MERGCNEPDLLFTLHERLGVGSFGTVYKALDNRTGKIVAIKIVDLDGDEYEVDVLMEEINILGQMESPFVTKYNGSYVKGTKMWIIMEYCSGGSCLDLLRAGTFAEPYVAIIAKEVLQGLVYLHAENKVHRDIKAANILLTGKGQVKLADFGVSGQLTQTVTKKNTFVGTPFWMAPEVIKQTGHNAKADIWSLGITLIELAHGDAPYADLHPMKVLFIIPKNPPPSLQGHFSHAFKDFVSLCLQKDPVRRPCARQLLHHPFIRAVRKTGFVTELIDRKERWLLEQRQARRESDIIHVQCDETPSVKETWDFGTVQPSAPADTIRQQPVKIALPQLPIKPWEDSGYNTIQQLDVPILFDDSQLLSEDLEKDIEREFDRLQNLPSVAVVQDENTPPLDITRGIWSALAQLDRQAESVGRKHTVSRLQHAFKEAEKGWPGIGEHLIHELMKKSAT